eukprot:scaffold97693_cov61-Phaeocystis_antarctica.AAC.3
MEGTKGRRRFRARRALGKVERLRAGLLVRTKQRLTLLGSHEGQATAAVEVDACTARLRRRSAWSAVLVELNDGRPTTLRVGAAHRTRVAPEESRVQVGSPT